MGWGNFEDDVKAEGDETNNTSVEEPPQEGEAAENKEEGAVEEKEPVSDEPKTLALDEWKAQQSKEKKEAPKFNVRKAGEGADIDAKWKKATIYRKENVEEREEEEEEIVYLQRANRQKKITDINFTFADESRGGGGGRGRGRGRGGRRDGPPRDRDGPREDRGDAPPRRGRGDGPRGGGRGGPRGGGARGGKKEFSLDQEAFPTLG